MKEFSIRKAIDGDVDDLWNCNKKILPIVYTLDEWKMLIDKYNVLVACNKKNIIGYVVSWGDFDQVRPYSKGHIVSFGVVKEERLKGIGRKLIEECIKEWVGLSVTLYVIRDDHGTISFYKKCGFVEELVMKDYYEDGVDGIMMRYKE